MRIISQNGLLDVPYESIAISSYSKNMATIVGTFPGNDLGKGDRVCILAEYSSEEKVIKAMEMCRQEYGKYFGTQGGISPITGAVTQPGIFTYPKVFQFPKEEEVENE